MAIDDVGRARATIENWEGLARALAGHFGGAVDDDARVFRFRTGLHSGFLNGLLRASVATADVADFAAEQHAWFPAGLPWRWVVGPGSAPPDLADRLRGLGFEARWPYMPAMTIDLDEFDTAAWRSDDVSVAEVLDATDLEDWLSVRRANLRLDDQTIAAWRRAHGALGLGPASRLRQFVGRSGDRPVASCTMFLDDRSRTAGIYHVDVLEDARGRGMGKAVTAAALGAAQELGYPLGVLTA